MALITTTGCAVCTSTASSLTSLRRWTQGHGPEVIRPTLSDYQGWATFIGTPKGRDWFYLRLIALRAARSWMAGSTGSRASETKIITDDELTSLRAGLTDEQYAQEFECNFEAAVIGAYYGRLMQQADQDKRISNVPYEPTVPVYTAWDLGVRDPRRSGLRRLSAAKSGSSIITSERRRSRSLRPRNHEQALSLRRSHRPARCAGQELGHGQEPPRSAGKSWAEKPDDCSDASCRGRHQRRRTIIPRCWFDAAKCARGIDALKLYRSEFDEKLMTLKPRPLHDWTSHGRCVPLSRNDAGFQDREHWLQPAH